MKPTSSNRGLLVAVLAISTGCATFVNPSTQPVTIVSDPPAAEVIVDSEGMGSTPTDVLLRRSDSEAAVRLQKDGFAPRVVRPRRSLSRWWIANLVVPALLSATLVPAGPGAAFPGKAGAFLRSSGSVPPSRPIAAFAGMAGIAFLTDLLNHRRRLRVSRCPAHRTRTGSDRIDRLAPEGQHRVGARFPPGPHRWRVSRRTGTAEEPAGRPMTSRPSRPAAARFPCTSTGDVLRLLLSKYKG